MSSGSKKTKQTNKSGCLALSSFLPSFLPPFLGEGNPMDSLRSAPFPLSPEEQLWQASTTGDLRRVIELVHTSPGINVNWQDEQVLRTPFYRACFFGHTRVVRFLLGIPEVSVTRCNSDGTTPFMAACSKGHEEVVRLLLADPRVDVEKAMKDGQTPLSVILEMNMVPIFKQLVASGREFRVDRPVDVELSVSIVSSLEWITFLRSFNEPFVTPRDIAQAKGHDECLAILNMFVSMPRKLRPIIWRELNQQGLPTPPFFPSFQCDT